MSTFSAAADNPSVYQYNPLSYLTLKAMKTSLLFLENSAAQSIEGFTKRMKMQIIKPRVSATVHGREGPLNAGVEEFFIKTVEKLAIFWQCDAK